MKSPICFAILLLSITSCSNNSISIPEVKFGGLKGNVSMIKDSKYKAHEKFGEIVPGDLNEVTVYEYDKDGHQVKVASYSSDGDCAFRIESFYENGLIDSETIFQRYIFDNNESTKTKVVDRRKNYVKLAYKYGTEDQYYNEVFYDGLSYCIFDENDGKVFEGFCDKAGWLIEQKNYSKGETTHRVVNEYDKRHRLIKETEHYKDEIVTETTYKYPEVDKKGNWITQLEYDGDGEIRSIVKREITYR